MLARGASVSYASPSAELVLAVAEQREVIAREPLEERARFGFEVVGKVRGSAQVCRGVPEPLEHLRPILDGRADVAQRRRERGLGGREQRRVGLAHDLEMDERLDLALAGLDAGDLAAVPSARRAAADGS